MNYVATEPAGFAAGFGKLTRGLEASDLAADSAGDVLDIDPGVGPGIIARRVITCHVTQYTRI